MNPWAVVALVTGILPLFPVAIVAGITALVQNGRRQLGGTGLAIAGIVLGGCWVVLGGLIALGAVFASTDSAELGRVRDAGSTAVGTCLQAPGDSDVAGTLVDCSVRHDAEVYLVRSLAGADDPWPGSDDVETDADDVCNDGFEDYVGESYVDSDYDYGFFDPDESEWREGERRVVCVVLPGGFDDTLTGSVRGGG
jgi:hypothetical protein